MQGSRSQGGHTNNRAIARVTTNHFQVTGLPNKSFHQYDGMLTKLTKHLVFPLIVGWTSNVLPCSSYVPSSICLHVVTNLSNYSNKVSNQPLFQVVPARWSQNSRLRTRDISPLVLSTMVERLHSPLTLFLMIWYETSSSEFRYLTYIRHVHQVRSGYRPQS